MSAGMIYTVHADGSLARMKPGAPATEDRMQELVARYPDLIQDDDGPPLLIRREQPVSDVAEASARWAVDHLFVTRAAIPVLVELKRAVDTRLRREVVGQLMDYAANSVAYWQAGTIATAFAGTCEAAGRDPDATLAAFLDGADAQTFWAQVDANFAAGRIKLVFVADVIPRELARIMEFMNEQMRADVRAIELKWFESDIGSTTLVPRVIGSTERAAVQKTTKAAALSPVSVDEWIEQNIRRYGDDVVRGAHAFIDVVRSLGGEVQVAKQQGSLIGVFQTPSGQSVYPLHLWKEKGHVSLSFAYLLKRPGLAEEARRVSHCAAPFQALANIGKVFSSGARHGRPFRATAAFTASVARSDARIWKGAPGTTCAAARTFVLIKRRTVWFVTPSALAVSDMVSHSPPFSADR
jgi:hypothetical protein